MFELSRRVEDEKNDMFMRHGSIPKLKAQERCTWKKVGKGCMIDFLKTNGKHVSFINLHSQNLEKLV